MTDLATLVENAQRGDHQAFKHLVQGFQDMAFAYAYAALGDSGLAQDAAQEAFIDAYLSLKNLREPAAFPGWFRRIVLKHSDRQIRGKRAVLVGLKEASALATPGADPADVMEEALFREDVFAAIELLPASQRSVTALFYVEGYSYRAIADFLDISVSAVKKRLFNSRQNLKERMIHMVQEKLQSSKPSRDDKFANQVLFFTAVLDNDTDAAKELIQKDAKLLEATAEWKMAIKRQYWTGATALDQAVGWGYGEMTNLLLGMGADVNAANKTQMTPLHTAAIMDRPELAEILIAAGAKVNAKSANEQTPLHVAAIRNRKKIVEILLKRGASVTLRDRQDRTAADWAALLGHQSIVKQLVGAGAKPPVVKKLMKPAYGVSELLETGIKIVDFCAPLKRGGVNGIFTPYSGVGFMVVVAQIVRSVQKIHRGAVIFSGLNTDHPHQEFWEIHLRESDADQDLTYFFEEATGDPAQPMALLQRVLGAAERLVDEGRETLLVLDGKLATSSEVQDAVRQRLSGFNGASALVYGHHTVGVLPPALRNLDSILTFSLGRALARLYPAIDPVRSSSTLFEELKGTNHAQLRTRARRLMTRYDELRYPYDAGGPETLWYIDDDPTLQETLTRARRLDRFLTQPLSSLEPWTGTLGEYVPLEETIRGCEAILNGIHDDVAEENFEFVGALE